MALLANLSLLNLRLAFCGPRITGVINVNIHIPAVSTPFRPALPIICLYVRKSINCPWNTGVRMRTRRAGRFTPEDRVEVAIKTFSMPCRKAPSTMSLSSKVRPVEKEQEFCSFTDRILPQKKDITYCLKTSSFI